MCGDGDCRLLPLRLTSFTHLARVLTDNLRISDDLSTLLTLAISRNLLLFFFFCGKRDETTHTLQTTRRSTHFPLFKIQ